MAVLAQLIKTIILKLGYFGIIVAMAIESACIPLPSEIIMPFSGFLVALGRFNFWWVATAGALGCLLGSSIAWWIGKSFGESFARRLIRRWGKFVLVFEYELDEAIEWFSQHGEAIVFTSRLLPVIRTFISLPAGIAQMNYSRFAFYTMVGSLIWSAVLAWVGLKLGENWEEIGGYFHQFDAILVFAFFLAAVWYFRHKTNRHRRWQQQNLKDKESSQQSARCCEE